MGQLIKDPYFTLFESVGALEVRGKFWIRKQTLKSSDHGPQDGQWLPRTRWNHGRRVRFQWSFTSRGDHRNYWSSSMSWSMTSSPIFISYGWYHRWLGTWVILFPKRSSQAFTSIEFCHHVPQALIRPSLTRVKAAHRMSLLHSRYWEPTVSDSSEHVLMSTTVSNQNITMRYIQFPSIHFTFSRSF